MKGISRDQAIAKSEKTKNRRGELMSSTSEEQIEELRKQNRELMGELNRCKGALLNLFEIINAAHSTTDQALKTLSRLGYPPWSPKAVHSLR